MPLGLYLSNGMPDIQDIIGLCPEDAVSQRRCGAALSAFAVCDWHELLALGPCLPFSFLLIGQPLVKLAH